MGLFDRFKKKDDLSSELAPCRKMADDRQRARESAARSGSAAFEVDDVFMISGKGCIAAGKIEQGTFQVGDEVSLIRGGMVYASSVIVGIEKYRTVLQSASYGENVGMLLKGMQKGEISKGDMIKK